MRCETADGAERQLDVVAAVPEACGAGSNCNPSRNGVLGNASNLLRDIEYAGLLRQHGVGEPVNRFRGSCCRGKAITLRFGLGRGWTLVAARARLPGAEEAPQPLNLEQLRRDGLRREFRWIQRPRWFLRRLRLARAATTSIAGDCGFRCDFGDRDVRLRRLRRNFHLRWRCNRSAGGNGKRMENAPSMRRAAASAETSDAGMDFVPPDIGVRLAGIGSFFRAQILRFSHRCALVVVSISVSDDPCSLAATCIASRE